MSDTNLVIVTDKRTYNIVLHFIGEETKKNADGTVSKSFIETPWAVRQAVLQLTYEYPFEQQEKAKSAADKNAYAEAEADGFCGGEELSVRNERTA